jgi:hypothetical protein
MYGHSAGNGYHLLRCTTAREIRVLHAMLRYGTRTTDAVVQSIAHAVLLIGAKEPNSSEREVAWKRLGRAARNCAACICSSMSWKNAVAGEEAAIVSSAAALGETDEVC